MKNLLLVLLFAGCAAEASNKTADAGIYSVHVENLYRYYHDRYYLHV